MRAAVDGLDEMEAMLRMAKSWLVGRAARMACVSQRAESGRSPLPFCRVSYL